MKEMDVPSVAQRQLEERCEAIAGRWYAVIAGTGYPVKSAQEVRQELKALARKAIDLLAGAELDGRGVEEIGAALARLHYVQPEALDGTLRVLGEQLADGRSDEGAGEILIRLALLLRGIATGFVRGACNTVLTEQETIRAALVGEIERSHGALQKAHDELEQRVKDRTAELARANLELQAEVSERRRVEKALRDSEESYRRLVEEMNDVVYVADRQGELTYVSPAVEALLGYKPEEIIGHRFAEFVYPGDLSRIEQGFQNLLAGQRQTDEYRFVAKSGDVRCGRTSSSPVVEDSTTVGFQGLLVDVTESRRASAALEASEERWRLLVENAPVLVVTIDQQFRVRFVNREPGEITTEMRLQDRTMLDYVRPDYVEVVAETVRRVFATGSNEYVEAPVLGVRGAATWYGVHMGPLRREGRVAEVMLIARDVTEEKQIAEMKDNLIRDASHELRTPLAKVQMSLELLVEMLEGEDLDRQKAIRISALATRSAEQMLRTVENILDLSRLEAGTWLDEWELIQPQALIREVVGQFVPLGASKGVDLAADLPASVPKVQGDWNKLYRVLQNLLYNAVKFSDKGEIVVTVVDRSGEVAIGVRDQGQGILPENLGRVFERFFQEKTRHPGAGLGLAICKAIVEEHGGRIWAESAGRGQGATFWFTLPAAPSKEDES
jgi:PAS domain S-box-containing protein